MGLYIDIKTKKMYNKFKAASEKGAAFLFCINQNCVKCWITGI